MKIQSQAAGKQPSLLLFWVNTHYQALKRTGSKSQKQGIRFTGTGKSAPNRDRDEQGPGRRAEADQASKRIRPISAALVLTERVPAPQGLNEAKTAISCFCLAGRERLHVEPNRLPERIRSSDFCWRALTREKKIFATISSIVAGGEAKALRDAPVQSGDHGGGHRFNIWTVFGTHFLKEPKQRCRMVPSCGG